jgi:hypothetical protein
VILVMIMRVTRRRELADAIGGSMVVVRGLRGGLVLEHDG